MIDFPASPTDGQIFNGSNGVVYKYSVAYSSWLATPVFTSPVMQMYSETVLAAPASSMDITIPAGAKALEIWFQAMNTGNANDATGFLLYDMVGGTPNAGANHSVQNMYGSNATVGAVSSANQVSWNLGGAQCLFTGVMRVQLNSAAGFNPVTINLDYAFGNNAGVNYKSQVYLYGGIAGTVTGFRLINGSGTTMIVGSYIRCFAVM